MSIEFNRRTFLKTSAALVGATALVGLTGCDGSSASHSINKKVGSSTYNVGGVIVDPQSNVGISGSYYELYLTLKNNTDADINIYPDNFSATYKNSVAPVEVDADDEPIQLSAKTDSAAAPEYDVYVRIPMIGTAQNTTDCVFLFSYNGKSIAFQSKNGELYTSGVFSDKVKF